MRQGRASRHANERRLHDPITISLARKIDGVQMPNAAPVFRTCVKSAARDDRRAREEAACADDAFVS